MEVMRPTLGQVEILGGGGVDPFGHPLESLLTIHLMKAEEFIGGNIVSPKYKVYNMFCRIMVLYSIYILTYYSLLTTPIGFYERDF